MVDGLAPLGDILKKYDIWPKKSLGQNFLLDFNITRKIARLANARSGVHFVEVGPGPGGLTRGLLYEGVDQLTVIERDDRTRPILEEIAAYYPDKLDIQFGDALNFNWTGLAPTPVEVVANLPYNIGTALLINWLSLEWPTPFSRLTLMFQDEVAERIIARPSSRAYGRLSALVQWRSDAEIIYRLPADAFTPPPKVASAIVSLRPKADLKYKPGVDVFSKVTATAFGQRRKMLRRSLSGISDNVVLLLETLGIDPTSRAGELDWSDYCRIALEVENG